MYPILTTRAECIPAFPLSVFFEFPDTHQSVASLHASLLYWFVASA
ncbi:Uncharacterised protein [Vibrio cholerae]|uniref:Uncharacterized protein n=1 Tax=Vibrio cholerae TaxID=666 RepID=A0A655YCA9_VIBCL|nr:Uncharacterised protein [Vibrio cholerae]